MARILIVDDEKSQMMSLGFALSARGHTVEMSTNASEGVMDGLRFRADCVFADWLLGGTLDGIRLAATLRAARPTTHAFLVTGFWSADLRRDAIDARLSGLFEKPLPLDRVEAAVEKAASVAAPPAEPVIGIVEYRRGGELIHVNERGKQILGLEARRPSAPRLDRIVGPRGTSLIERAIDEWVPLVRVGLDRPFSGYTLRGGKGQNDILLVLDASESRLKKSDTVLSLIRAHAPSAPRESNAGRILIIDRDNLQRRLAGTQFRLTERTFHAAESEECAARLLAADPNLEIILLDWETPTTPILDFVAKIRELRPDARIIGTSTAPRRKEFADIGVEDFLLKPVLATALDELLARTRA